MDDINRLDNYDDDCAVLIKILVSHCHSYVTQKLEKQIISVYTLFKFISGIPEIVTEGLISDR